MLKYRMLKKAGSKDEVSIYLISVEFILEHCFSLMKILKNNYIQTLYLLA